MQEQVSEWLIYTTGKKAKLLINVCFAFLDQKHTVKAINLICAIQQILAGVYTCVTYIFSLSITWEMTSAPVPGLSSAPSRGNSFSDLFHNGIGFPLLGIT